MTWEPAQKYIVRLKGDSPFGMASKNALGRSTTVHARSEEQAREMGASLLQVSPFLVDVFRVP